MDQAAGVSEASGGVDDHRVAGQRERTGGRLAVGLVPPNPCASTMAGRGVAGSVVRIVASSATGLPSGSGVPNTISGFSITLSWAYAGIGNAHSNATRSSIAAARPPRMRLSCSLGQPCSGLAARAVFDSSLRSLSGRDVGSVGRGSRR